MYRQLLILALPVILSQGIQTIMVFTDRCFLSFKGTILTSAATTGGFLALSFSLFFISFLQFSLSLIGKRFGSREIKEVYVIVWQGLIVATLFIPLLFFLQQCGFLYFQLLRHPSDYCLLENAYYKVLILAQIPVLYRTVLECFCMGTGNSRPILYASVIGVISNIPLTYVFVLGPLSFICDELTGAALATCLANLFSTAYLLLYFQKQTKKNPFRVLWKDIWSGTDLIPFLRQGFFSGLEKFINSFCFISFVNMFLYYGKEVGAAISIVFTIDQVAFLPIMGIYSSVMSLFSRFLGSQDANQAIKAVHAALKLSFFLMSAFSLIFFLFGDQISSLFVDHHHSSLNIEEIQSYVHYFLRTTTLYVFANAIIFIYKAGLRSLGYSGWCLYFSLVVHLILVISCYLSVYYFHWLPQQTWNLFLGMLFTLAITFTVKFYAAFPSRKGASQARLGYGSPR